MIEGRRFGVVARASTGVGLALAAIGDVPGRTTAVAPARSSAGLGMACFELEGLMIVGLRSRGGLVVLHDHPAAFGCPAVALAGVDGFAIVSAVAIQPGLEEFSPDDARAVVRSWHPGR